ncbi:MAG: thioredoxin family protein [Burkholderiaceae bacterium]|nr:thioredoxin family protein [Burkholderiaceae bacterium]
MPLSYTPQDLSSETLKNTPGFAVLAFGTNWCGHCQAAAPEIDAALTKYPRVKHLQVEDGKGRKLGREFGVKLWPTLIFLRDGVEIDRLVRPTTSSAVGESLKKLQP